MSGFSNSAAIVGIGATEFSKESGRSELQLSCEATLAALADAGLTPKDVDGLVTFKMDNSSEIALARELVLGSRLGMENIAERAGFASTRQFRRAWNRLHAMPPASARAARGDRPG